mmetsp:Transcript_69043/g.202113  ORF Transcript_69043/g.202113 Transcript_69043/m.202113 type:complete len:494 (-) Transcript_69043:208-1689(-)
MSASQDLHVSLRCWSGEVIATCSIKSSNNFADLAKQLCSVVGSSNDKQPHFIWNGVAQLKQTTALEAGLHDGCEIGLVWSYPQIPPEMYADLDRITHGLSEKLDQGISELQVDWEASGNEGVMAISKALPYCRLTQLELTHYVNSPEEAGDAMGRLAAALPCCCLHTLCFRDTDFGREGDVTLFGHVLSARSNLLTTLQLRGALLRDAGTIAVAGALPQCSLTALDLSCNRIGPDGLRALAEALPHCKLQNLNLAENHEVGQVSWRTFVEAISKSNLTTLDLSQNRLGDKGICILAEGLGKCSLLKLNLQRNYPELPATMHALAEAVSLCGITALNLAGNNICDEGLSLLGHALPRCSLKQLIISYNSLGDMGVTELAEELPRTNLTALDLAANRIGNTGVYDVARALPKCSSLMDLSLAGSFMEASSAEAIAQALPQCSLRHLNLIGSLDHADKAVIQAAARTTGCEVLDYGSRPQRMSSNGDENADFDLFD